jgi:hypothetical protein
MLRGGGRQWQEAGADGRKRRQEKEADGRSRTFFVGRLR